MKDDFIDDTTDEEMAAIDDAKLRALLAQAAQLPKAIEPPVKAWKAIRDAIETPVAADAFGSGGTHLSQPIAFWQRPVFLAAAAALLVAGSSVVTALVTGARTHPPQPAVAASTPVERRRPVGPGTLAEFTVVENDYIRMANQLSEVLQSDDSNLAPETIAKLNESLRIIDAAINEARRALAADPANRAIVESLVGTYEQKLDLLRRTTEMARS